MGIFSYMFMQRAFLGGIGIALACGLLGPFLVLRKQSLLGDGLAHLAFGGIALGLLFGIDPLWSALITSLLGSWAVQKMIRRKIYGDAAIALLLSLGVGTGVVILSLVGGFNVGLFNYLIGSVLALNNQDLLIISVILLADLLLLWKFYPVWFFLTFNEELAKIQTPSLSRAEFFFTAAVAITVVISIRAVGVLLVSALLVIPTLTALVIARSFKETIPFTLLIGSGSVISGILIAYAGDISPGGSIVLVLFTVYLIVLGFKKILVK